MQPKSGKMLVIRGGAIGDFILTLPAIAALRQQFPNVHLEVLGYPHIASLAMAAALVDRVQPIEARALAGFFARGGDLDPGLADYFSEFDLIISYLYDPDQIFEQNVARCSPAQFIAGPHRPNEAEPVPASRVFLRPLERLAIFGADEIPRLSLVSALSNQMTLSLHPGSGSDRKNWPEAQWASLLNELIVTTDFDLLLVGGEAEGERLKRLAAALPPDRTVVAHRLPLPELGALLQSCTAFVGHDSGISHLAAALGLPGLVLWGESNEAVWRPPSSKFVLVRHPEGLVQLQVTEVLKELLNLISSLPEVPRSFPA